MENVLITGGNGPERHEYISSLLEKLVKEGKNVVIYDATYSFSFYDEYPNVHYFCADHSLSYIKHLKELNNSNDTAYIVSDIYGGLFFSKENKELMLDILKKKDQFSVTFYTRHLDYVPEVFLSHFDSRIEHDDVIAVIANGK